ncbi:nickel-dependent hydrogenase large subunit [Sedimenticola thiotaurini]|uniref:HupV protein n=1 Tax=Sedimenticola thiotaurini TaxID=1543721 RepID=A0A0F7JTR7_9GAMM|nr:nickel-dependent hydrogenase large subunit [Sedimenticola thiotaurini]AKH19037.1 HupV protein [Sedimenticola thiotaurini]
MSKLIVGPFNRVEGDLEVQIETADGVVEKAWVVSPMYRGFEQILHGKDPRDALIYTPRICGICSVSQSIATADALARAGGVERPKNGELALNLIHACENLADHFTHFYLFFMPDFARDIYRDESWFSPVAERFKAVRGRAAPDVMQARAEFMHLMGIMAGKWPHTLGIQPGGSTRSIETKEKVRLLSILGGFRRFLEQRLFNAPLEQMLEIGDQQQLEDWLAAGDPAQSDFRRLLQLSRDLHLDQLGKTDGRFMSYGVYPLEGARTFRAGLWYQGVAGELDTTGITEDISHSWMEGQAEPQHPFQGVTLPSGDPDKGYSWCKAPRLDGEVVEVGALARQLIDGQPLVNDLVQRSGSNVRNRVIARLLEMPRVLIEMEQWVRQLKPSEPYCSDSRTMREAEGVGLTEAARGSLGHWVRIKHGRILNYQIIAPTTWNFSPRDQQGISGPLEQALIGAPVRQGEREPVAVQHIVRSFDPCMVCTVH